MTNNNNSNQKQQQPLLTSSSVALSLAPPRVPPHGSVLRRLYTHPKSTHRHLLLLHKQQHSVGHHDTINNKNDKGKGGYQYQSHTIRSRLLQLFTSQQAGYRGIPLHPHLPTSLSIPDQMTRFLGAILPLETQHSFRDGGYLKSVADTMVALSCPLVGIGHWEEVREFMELSYSNTSTNEDRLGDHRESLSARENNVINDNADVQNLNNDMKKDTQLKQRDRRKRWTRKRIPYGGHPMQYIDLFLPSNETAAQNNSSYSQSNDHNHASSARTPVRGTIFFVHGGAWGSGQPWMYRLVAPVFLKLNFAVVIVGYRTYPDAQTIDEQCGDVKLAWDMCEDVLNELLVMGTTNNFDDGDQCWVGNVIMGHSSGAHVALLMLVDWIGERIKTVHNDANSIHNDDDTRKKKYYPWTPDYFVGLSGPYDISYHFDYEAGRGVEQISPMKPICGHSRDNFNRANPVKRLVSLFRKQRDEGATLQSAIPMSIQQLTPPILLVHGIEDPVVPFTATADAGRTLRSCGLQKCDEIYLEETGHQDVIMHFMMGGQAKDLVLGWLFQCSTARQEKTKQLQSRL